MTTAGGRRVDKPWGHELIWAHTDRYVGKILVIETGKRLSLQRHEIKDESILVRAGRLRLFLEDDSGVVRVEELGPGDHRHVRTGGHERPLRPRFGTPRTRPMGRFGGDPAVGRV